MVGKNIITLYGRHTVFEALCNRGVSVKKLHLSRSNKPSRTLDKIVDEARKRDVEVVYHTKRQLSFISKNAKQDQGVALDIVYEKLYDITRFLDTKKHFRLLALEGVNNPQNIGLIIRSAVAGDMDGVILPVKKKNITINPLIVKASAGTLFKLPLIVTHRLQDDLRLLKKNDTALYALDAKGGKNLFAHTPSQRAVYILGGESEGVSEETVAMCDETLCIPMRNGIESLNVAMSATLVSFCSILPKKEELCHAKSNR